MASIAFIGLGVMGGPIAGHLAKAGHSLTVYNRSIGKAKTWAETYGGAVAISPAK
uniref:NAD(P)-binding domain-containing protein n=1 Tax=Sphingobium sp. TaxID=1912891 RepID=UPI003B3A0B94